MAGTPATLALTRAHITFTEHEYTHDPRAESFGREAADALGLDPAVVFKTLVATVEGGATRGSAQVVAVVPVTGMLDLKALAAAVGARRADLADPAVAQRLTGYIVGGISPIGQKRPLPTVIDESALLLDQMFVSGGRRGLDIGLSPQDLATVTSAQFAAIARRD